MEVGQGPNWSCSTKEKKKEYRFNAQSDNMLFTSLITIKYHRGK
jgi:hypothetical protein